MRGLCKQLLILFWLIIFIASSFDLAQALNDKTVNLYINNEAAIFTDQQPLINQDNRVLVPLRFIAEHLRMKVSWDEPGQAVYLEGDTKMIMIKPGETAARINGQETHLDTSAILTPQNRVMVPLRFIAESMGAIVRWHNESKTVYLNSENAFQTRATTIRPRRQYRESTVIASQVSRLNNPDLVVDPRDQYYEQNRNNNVQLAARAINGYILKSNSVFSFNEVVGPRTPAIGYLPAKVIVGGQFVPGIGGGVSQASTVVYRSAVEAGFDILEKRKHSLPVFYGDEGEDTTVVYGQIDLRFRNNTANDALMIMFVKDHQIYLTITTLPADLKQSKATPQRISLIL